MPFFSRNKKEDPQKDIAFFTMRTVEAIIHMPLEKMLVEAIERIKDFFQTEHACIHFYSDLGLNEEIATFGLLSCPLATVPSATQEKLIEVENRLNALAMTSAEVIRHKDIFQKVQGWDKFNDYFEFNDGFTIPLKYQEEIYGALDIYHKEPTSLSVEDVRFLNALGSCLYGAVKKEVLIRELLDRDDLIEAFAKTIEASDRYTGGHVDRVMNYAARLGEAVGLNNEEMKVLKRAALLHDVGKIGVPESILNKNGPLTENERETIQTHPVIAEDIFANIKEGSLKQSMDGIVYHHERIDGNGYPRGLKGEEIPLTARIIAIADTFDALTSNRPYRKGMDTQAALKILEEVKGSQLDAKLVELFIGKELYKDETGHSFKEAS